MISRRGKPFYAAFGKKTTEVRGKNRRKLLHYYLPIKSGLYQNDFQDFGLSDYAEAVFEGEAPAGISPINICPKNLQIQEGTTVKMMGWGPDVNSENSNHLNEVDLKVAKPFSSKIFLFTKALYDGEAKGSCPGDSGGPLLLLPFSCLLGTTVGDMWLHGGSKLGISGICLGTPGSENVNDKNFGIFNIVPEMTTKLQKFIFVK